MANETPQEGIAIQFLGQSGFLFKRKGLTVVIDPYLSDSGAEADPIWRRSFPPPVNPAAMKDVDLVLCTHEHGDHTDGQTLLSILSASPKCRFAGPKASTVEMIRAGLPESQIAVLNEGGNFTLSDLVVEPIASAHEEYEVDGEGFQRWLGYLLHWGGVTFYHSGDTVVTPLLEKTIGKRLMSGSCRSTVAAKRGTK
jgi:L-ascorbate metabolism protein UlaG (beta-lactamase superfamily)